MDITAKLNQANGRLRSAKVGVIIGVKGDRLHLRATFPPKPDSTKPQPYQQRLALGYHANPAGISLAETEARKVGALIDCRQFSWQPYLIQNQNLKAEAIADWIIKFERHYFERRAKNPKSMTTWKSDYLAVLRRLPQDPMLTPQLLTAAILGTEPDSKTRKRFCMVLQAFAKFAGIEFDARPFAGSYSPKRVTPRDLPEDRLIAEWFSKINNDSWRWIYGIIATFGLRPHEVFYLDTSDLEAGQYILRILDGKTGARRVWACYPE